MYKIFFTKRAEKDLGKIAGSDKRRILNKVSVLNFPLPSGLDISSLTGVESFYRLRVGRVRVIFEIDKGKKEIWIRHLGYRGSIYGQL